MTFWILAPGISDQVANYNLLEGFTQRSKFLEIDIKLHCNIIIVNMGFGPFSPGDLVRWVGLLIAISSVFRPAISSLFRLQIRHWGEASLQGHSTPTGRSFRPVRACVRAPSVIHIESGMTVCSPSLFPFAPESITSISLFPSGFVSWSLSEQV